MRFLRLAASIALLACNDATGPLENTQFLLQSVDGNQGPTWSVDTKCQSHMVKDVLLEFVDGGRIAFSYNCTSPGGAEVYHGVYSTQGDSVWGGVQPGVNLNSSYFNFGGKFSADRKSVSIVVHEWGDVRLVFGPCLTCSQ